MECKKCKKECMESELKNGLCEDCCDMELVKKEKNTNKADKKKQEHDKPLYKKWWFWVCVVILTVVISFIILAIMAYFYMKPIVSSVASQIKNIDSQAVLYIPTNGDTVIVEISDYSKVTVEGLSKIKEIIKNETNNSLSNCTKFALVTKLKDSTSDNSYVSVAVYNLPSMELNSSLSKSYMDVTTTTNSNSTSTQATQTPIPATTVAEPTTQTTTNNSISLGQKNALAKAKSYLEYSAFSHKGLVEQLEYEGFSEDEATYGADNCGADWNDQASKKAKSYMNSSSFSQNSLIEQLGYEGFTKEQAEYAAKTVGY